MEAGRIVQQKMIGHMRVYPQAVVIHVTQEVIQLNVPNAILITCLCLDSTQMLLKEHCHPRHVPILHVMDISHFHRLVMSIMWLTAIPVAMLPIAIQFHTKTTLQFLP